MCFYYIIFFFYDKDNQQQIQKLHLPSFYLCSKKIVMEDILGLKEDIQELKKELKRLNIEYLCKFGLDEHDAVFAMNAVENGCPIGDLLDCLPKDVDVKKIKRFLLEKKYADLTLQRERIERLRELNDSLLRTTLHSILKMPPFHT